MGKLSNNLKFAVANGRISGTVWAFETARFRVLLKIEPDNGYSYDGEDPDGEVQAKLDSGEFVAFDSEVVVEFDGAEIASDHLGGHCRDRHVLR